MSFGFVQTRREGKHFDLVKFAFKRLKQVNLSLKTNSEREYEQAVVSNLQSSKRLRNNLITQVSDEEVEKITHANLFGFKHRPDATIGNDGTAIEIKLISRGNDIRDILGQGFCYRISYRFCILVIADNTNDKYLIELCKKSTSKENQFLSYLAEEFNIFSIVGPKGISSNIGFFPKIESTQEKDDSENDDVEEPKIEEAPHEELLSKPNFSENIP